MDWAKKLVGRITSSFRSTKGQREANRAVLLLGPAAKTLVQVMPIVVGLTPNKVDDVVWAVMQQTYPNLLLDIRSKTDEERKLAAFAVAAEVLRNANPWISTSIARTAVQLAYLDFDDKKRGGCGV